MRGSKAHWDLKEKHRLVIPFPKLFQNPREVLVTHLVTKVNEKQKIKMTGLPCFTEVGLDAGWTPRLQNRSAPRLDCV